MKTLPSRRDNSALQICNPRDASARTRVLYDTWTDDYDQRLLISCHYSSPARVARVVAQQGNACTSPWWDLGAGSGLVGAALLQAGLTLPLIAVDFSQTMLGKLSCANYIACCKADVLQATELRDCARHAPRTAGALAVGVSEYVVDLEVFFSSCTAVVAPGETLVFTHCPTEAADCEVFEPFEGLYAHSAQHVAQALAAQGFETLATHDGPGYLTAGQAVDHRIVVARRR